jgi:hypothetical protein
MKRRNVIYRDFFPYDPGVIPTLPSPTAGESVSFRVAGLPPYKDVSQSIRNITHPRYESFSVLRSAAIAAMKGRAWFFGPIKLDLTIYAPALHPNRGILDYMAGVMDTLGGSSGNTFTYLPIMFEDDCQVCSSSNRFHQSDEEYYDVAIEFMASGERNAQTRLID